MIDMEDVAVFTLWLLGTLGAIIFLSIWLALAVLIASGAYWVAANAWLF